MKFLSQAFVEEVDLRRLRMSDCYQWHKKLWELFADSSASAGEAVQFLFRVDSMGRRNRVLVLSDTRPSASDWARWSTTEVKSGFLEADSYRFQLKANPTVKRKKTDQSGGLTKNGRRTGIYGHQELVEWIQRKAEQSGFDLVGQVDYAGPVDEFFVKNRRRGKLTTVDFRGGLRVTNRKFFKKAFENGIGSAKGFGFGMLMLQPAS
jgi:CRISPR system Cascade subunit CasE